MAENTVAEAVSELQYWQLHCPNAKLNNIADFINQQEKEITTLQCCGNCVCVMIRSNALCCDLKEAEKRFWIPTQIYKCNKWRKAEADNG